MAERPDSLFGETYSVSELCTEIRDFLGEAFSGIWVAGEVSRVRRSQRGHLYFELVEKGSRDEICGKLDAVIWRSDHQRIGRLLAAEGQEITEGIQIRCRGSIDFYGAGGRLQLIVREVDPVFTLGLLAQRRRETLAALAAAGLLERNKALPLADLPLRIALVTSEGSAAYHDFLSTLAESGYGFSVLFVHATVQGVRAEREVVSALAAAGTAADCILLIRGGGSRTDLAAFDSRAIAEAVARSPVPVITGLGHQIDQAVADLVAHTALKTPTKVAEFLIERVARADLTLAELQRALTRASMERLRDGREALGAAERGVELARLRLASAGRRVDEIARALAGLSKGRLQEADRRRRELSRRLSGAAPRRIARAGAEPRLLGERLVAAARGHLRQAEATVGGLARLAAQLAPERTLERGYSITRTEAGALVRRPEEVTPGDRLNTQLAGGTLASRVEER